MLYTGTQGSAGTKEASSGNVISGIHDGDIMASIKDPNMKEIVAKESLQYKPNSKNEGPEVPEETKKALSNLLEVFQTQLSCKKIFQIQIYSNNFLIYSTNLKSLIQFIFCL